jgi:hypothetical protein
MIIGNRNPITPNDMAVLREKGLLSHNETAIIEGDLIVALNVVTQRRRVLQVDGLLLECRKTLLRD